MDASGRTAAAATLTLGATGGGGDDIVAGAVATTVGCALGGSRSAVVAGDSGSAACLARSGFVGQASHTAPAATATRRNGDSDRSQTLSRIPSATTLPGAYHGQR